VLAALDREDIPEADAIDALQHFPKLWDQLFPGEQARIGIAPDRVRILPA